MTFPEQILGVPPALVEQGWRREPPRAVQLAWHDDRVTDPNRLQRWSTCVIRVRYDVEAVHIWRPELIGAHSNATAVYAHQGWGDGMSPTPEMVKVWRFWWVDIGNGPRVKDCEVVEYERTPERYWLGPVLPPVRQS